MATGIAGNVLAAGAGESSAFLSEEGRNAAYVAKARQLNEAADWYLFEVRPLVYSPPIVSKAVCEDLGDNCPERAGLSVISEMYRRPPQIRSAVTLSKPERDVIAPMRILATSAVFDPDTCDELKAVEESFEQTSAKFESAARRGNLEQTRNLYDKGREELNAYFSKVNGQTGLPQENEFFLRLLPASEDVLDNDQYWVRRKEKWLVKKKVDAMSKGSKTARFYAKSIFGDDAVSWDPRGDRAADYATTSIGGSTAE